MQTGVAPARTTPSIRRSIASNVRSIEIGTTSTSPQSATRRRSNGWTLSTGFHVRIKEDCSRTARGPKRAPVRYDVPPSYGTPSSATSRPSTSPAGSSMKVAIWPNRGDWNGLRGTCNGFLDDVGSLIGSGRPAERGHRVRQQGDLLGRVVHREARTARADDAAPAHQRLRAVMTGAHGDALRVEGGGDVVGMPAVDRERDDGGTLASRAVDPHSRDRAQHLHRLQGKRLLVLAHTLHAELLEILDRRGEPDGLGDRRRAGLESPGQIVPRRAVDPDFLDHLAATAR